MTSMTTMTTIHREDSPAPSLLSPAEFEARIAPALERQESEGSTAKLILLGFGGLDLLVGDLGTEGTRVVLRDVESRLADLLPEGIPAAHLFGDRFAILVREQGSPEEFTEHFLTVLRAPLSFRGTEITLQPRFGMATAQNTSTSQDLIRRATAALQRAESTGGRTPTLYQTNQMPLHAADPSLARDLEPALDQGQIKPWFQPVWRLSDGAIVGVEALARWEHPTRGLLSPAIFLPLARRAGLLGRLDSAIRCQGLAWLSRVRARFESARDLTIAVNVADADLVDPDLLETMLAELEQYDLPVDALHLELSERAKTAQAPEIQGRIRRMASAGLRWHLDDFGTGHSNIQRLRGLPFSAVKLDRSMVRGLGRDPHAEHLLKPMIALARVLNLQIIAEGVERGEQLQTLTRLNCDMAQGHHISPPRPAAAIEALFEGTGASPRAVEAAAQAVDPPRPTLP